MNIREIKISAYPNALSKQGAVVPLLSFLQSKKHVEKIQEVRACPDPKKKSELKKWLPAATISGVFQERRISGLQHYNGLICLDFDGKDNPGIAPDEIKNTLSEFSETAYAGLSVGGAGVFAIIATNNRAPERHSEVVEFLGKICATQGLHIDPACKDVCRLRFVSYDPDAHLNSHPQPFDVRFLGNETEADPIRMRPITVRKIVPTEKPAPESIREQVENIISEIESQRRDVTDDYQNWIKIGAALAAEYGADGEDYFQRISQFHPQYNREKTSIKFKNLCQNRKKTRIATFFYLTK